MPQILVVTEAPTQESAVVYRERISSADLESPHFSGQLVERVAWAVGDADMFEREASKVDESQGDRREERRDGAERGVLQQVRGGGYRA